MYAYTFVGLIRFTVNEACPCLEYPAVATAVLFGITQSKTQVLTTYSTTTQAWDTFRGQEQHIQYICGT